MNSATITIKTTAATKSKAQERAAQLGVSLSTLLSDYLKQFVKTKSGTIEREEEPSDYLKRVIRQAEKNRKDGKGSPLFTDNEELLKSNPKKYRHIDTMEAWFHKQGI